MKSRLFSIFISGILFSVIWTWLFVLNTSPTKPNLSSQTSQIQTSATVSRDPAAASANVCSNIYELVCQNKGETHDPTGVVRPDIDGERQAIHMYQEIIQKHRDWSMEQVDEELAIQIYDPKRRARIESAYKWVKGTMLQVIEQQLPSVFKNEEKDAIKNRLKKTELQLPFPASIYADEPDLLKKNEVFYERLSNGQMRLRVGGAYVLIARSWFNLVFTLAHELAHSIDPQEIKAAGLSIPTYDRLVSCFIGTGLISKKLKPEAGLNERLSETFADWFAVQVTIEALKIFATEFHQSQVISAARNSVRDLCEQDTDNEDLDIEIHPSPKIRINQIFGPPIRAFLGCPVSTSLSNNYCRFEPAQGARKL